MTRSTAIPLDKRRDDPEDRGPMLAWWAGVYDHVFVALHPFCAVSRETNFFDATKAAPQTRWRDVAASAGATDFGDFAVTLVTAYFGPRPEARVVDGVSVPTDEDVDGLKRHIVRAKLDFPWDDSVSPALEPALAEAFARIGAETLTVWSEFREETAEIDRAALAQPVSVFATALSDRVHVVQDQDGQMLVSAAFDDLWSLIAMTGAARDAIDPETLFEGFWAGQETTVNWLNEPGTYAPPRGWP